MSQSAHTERVPPESPLLWPALALFVILVATWVWYHEKSHPVSGAGSKPVSKMMQAPDVPPPADSKPPQ